MSRVKNVKVYRKKDEGRTSYVMFLEWEDLRFSKVWGLADDSELDPEVIVDIMAADAQDDLDEAPVEHREVGTPASNPFPEWLEKDGWEEWKTQ